MRTLKRRNGSITTSEAKPTGRAAYRGPPSRTSSTKIRWFSASSGKESGNLSAWIHAGRFVRVSHQTAGQRKQLGDGRRTKLAQGSFHDTKGCPKKHLQTHGCPWLQMPMAPKRTLWTSQDPMTDVLSRQHRDGCCPIKEDTRDKRAEPNALRASGAAGRLVDTNTYWV